MSENIESLTKVILVLPHRAGWSLASLFTEYVVDRYCRADDPEVIEAGHIHFEVDARGWSYLDVVDFQCRLPSLLDAGKVGHITLLRDEVPLWDDQRLTSELMRVLRTVENPKMKFFDANGSLLSTGCIVELLKQLYECRPQPE